MALAGANVALREGAAADHKLSEIRQLYEPHVNALAAYLLMPLPSWLPAVDASDYWKRFVEVTSSHTTVEEPAEGQSARLVASTRSE